MLFFASPRNSKVLFADNNLPIAAKALENFNNLML